MISVGCLMLDFWEQWHVLLAGGPPRWAWHSASCLCGFCRVMDQLATSGCRAGEYWAAHEPREARRRRLAAQSPVLPGAVAWGKWHDA